MKNTIQLSILITLLFALSCNSKKNITVKPETTSITGDLGEYFEVVQKEYSIPIDDDMFKQLISVELKRTDKEFPFKTNKLNPFGTNGGEEYHVGFGIDLIGETGPVEKSSPTEGGTSGPFSNEDVEAMFKLKKGETAYIRWSVDNPKEIKTFRISSAIEKSEHSTGTISDNSISSESSTSSNSDENYDKMLDDYEEYVDEYLKFFKKAKNGDQSAMMEYPTLMEKATALQSSMADAQSNNQLSTSQAGRLLKIQTKMTKAAL